MNDIGVIHLTNGGLAFVDSELFDSLNKFKWQQFKNGVCRCKWIDGKPSAILLHRQILRTPIGMDTDHKNGNVFDNRRCNLRIATRSQNCGNAKKRKDGLTSKFRGVSWSKDKNKWFACIGRPTKYLGRFNSEENAANAYNEAAKIYFGEFASLNKI